MTQRFSGISDQEANGLAAEILAGSRQFMGRSSNLLRILTKHSPYLARWFIGFVATVRQPDLGARSDARLRALACIKTSMANECTYCATHTSMFGQALGLSTAELEALPNDAFRTSSLFDERDKAVIAWSEAVTKNEAKKSGKAWDDMRRLFSDAEIVEITLASAMFNMINRLNDTFRTELESVEYNRLQGNAVKGRSVEQLEEFAGRFPATGRAERERNRPVAAE